MTDLSLHIDKTRPTPAFMQLKEQIAGAIRRRELPAGTALPSERHLSAELGLSRMTVRRAFEELAAEGLVDQRQGSGTYVRGRPVEQTFDRVLGFSDEAEALGFRPGTTLLEMHAVKADRDVAEALQIGEGEPVLAVTRLRTADGAPLAVQVAHLAPPYSDLSREKLRKNESLYRTLEKQFGVSPYHARQTVAARQPTELERRRLDLPPNVPVLALERITYDAHGAPFEYVRSAYRGDRYRMAQNLRPPSRGVDGTAAARAATASAGTRRGSGTRGRGTPGRGDA